MDTLVDMKVKDAKVGSVTKPSIVDKIVNTERQSSTQKDQIMTITRQKSSDLHFAETPRSIRKDAMKPHNTMRIMDQGSELK